MKATDVAVQNRLAEINVGSKASPLTIMYEGNGKLYFVGVFSDGIARVSQTMTRREALTWLDGYYARCAVGGDTSPAPLEAAQ